jgi:hypothetical protein
VLPSSGSEVKLVAGCGEHYEAPLGTIKGKEFLDYKVTYLLVKDCAPWS